MTMATPQTTLASHLDEIEATLTSFLDEFPEPDSLYAPVRYLFDGGGKRIRPLLTVLCCEAAGGSRHHCLSAAVAVELLHNFTLVHDDIMDSSPIRRGRPTVHVRWNDGTAILSGDVMIGMAMRLLERSALHSPRPLDVMSAFSTGLIDVCDGQALDLALMHRDDVTVDDYFDMITKKTAKLLEASAAIGGHMAGTDTTTFDHLRTFAREIGIAFQVQDDLLDLIGSEAFGKTPGGDIIEGKRTWLVLTARERARHHENVTYSALIEEFFANGGLSRERIPDVIAMMDALGVLADARTLVQELSDDAFRHLHALPFTHAQTLLETLGRQLMERVS